ncbi:MAG TPA: hypothetical protein VGR43_04890, partial [Dehalococcoidia bacterium]|nr:hypothetical protein [Dehalococcoidia bacterium]
MRGRIDNNLSRREFISSATILASGLQFGKVGSLAGADLPKDVRGWPAKALIAISFDLEMARNFPRWEDT